MEKDLKILVYLDNIELLIQNIEQWPTKEKKKIILWYTKDIKNLIGIN